ncbi:N-acetylmuramoyl-L-alanine amidase [Pacificibacter maritimus]|uniref:N-acetylmuramoyl-L-alanine amidase n=1 Tax=Pacificibacter maritimus TaxID=762213 RepID=A0A3N4UNS4_9RHOB|nr:N-acetylmuramoyl-L-alanine amidase [Pacificibacter maritimus]RPE72073.1 N-acetylmuramoyl-L-alanine amidase [Pacificibacter maritimus]
MTKLNCQFHASPNFGDRRGGVRPDMIVLHYTAMNCAQDALARLCDPEFEVSAHYLIDSDGRIVQMVDEAKRAWHAGAGAWGNVSDVNSHSIGIELSNAGTTPFAAAQMDALESLLAQIMRRHKIKPERIIGHSDMAPARKIDPGPRFDWHRLARQGFGVWPAPAGALAVDQDAFLQALNLFGYHCEDQKADVILSVFRDRFRPRHEGPLDEIDMALAHDLAQRFPVDRASPSD